MSFAVLTDVTDASGRRLLSTALLDAVLLRDSSTKSMRLAEPCKRAARVLDVNPTVLTALRWLFRDSANPAVGIERPEGEASLPTISRSSSPPSRSRGPWRRPSPYRLSGRHSVMAETAAWQRYRASRRCPRASVGHANRRPLIDLGTPAARFGLNRFRWQVSCSIVRYALHRLSVIIPNYNYGRFLGDAVRSALAVDWPNVEVIVVDDGSTDDSLAVLDEFLGNVILLTQNNAGPRLACNRGFKESSGDAVIFLDSDDMVEPSIAREVAAVWQSNVTKVQVQMRRVDHEGKPRGRVFPNYVNPPDPEQIRHWMTTTSAYPTPPGSGNVYSRRFLERLFPIDERCGDATDSACLAAAPYLGDVITVVKPLVRYRVHDSNRSALLADGHRFAQQIDRARQRELYAQEVSGRGGQQGLPRDLRALRRGRHLLQMRVAELRLRSSEIRPIDGDSRSTMILDSFATVSAPGPESMLYRLCVTAWCLLVLTAPKWMATKLVRLRFR